MALKEFFAGTRCRIAYQGSLIVVCLEGAIEVSDLDELGKCQDLIVPTVPKISSITVMNAGFLSVKPGSAQRAAELSAKYKGKTGASIVVVNGRGLMAVMARTGIAMYSMLDRSGTNTRTFGSVPDGMKALQEGVAALGTPMTQAEVTEVLKFIDARPIPPKP